MVYFVRNSDSGAVKIGFTASDPLSRLKTLQTANTCRLELIAVIPGVPCSEETKLHRRFAHLKIAGEWFRLDRDLAEHIAGNAIEWRDVRALKSGDRATAKAQEKVIRDHIAASVRHRTHSESVVARARRWAALRELGLSDREIATREGWEEHRIAETIDRTPPRQETWESVLAGKTPKSGETRSCEKCEDEFLSNQKDRFCKACRKSVLAAMKASGYLTIPPRRTIHRGGTEWDEGVGPSFENAVRVLEG